MSVWEYSSMSIVVACLQLSPTVPQKWVPVADTTQELGHVLLAIPPSPRAPVIVGAIEMGTREKTVTHGYHTCRGANQGARVGVRGQESPGSS